MKVDDKVRLRRGYPSLGAYGMLNSIFLHEEGAMGVDVPVIAVDGKYAMVLLPSGNELEITERDIS